MSEKGNEQNGPEPKTGKNGSYQKVDDKPEKKRDLSKLPHFGKKDVCWSCGEPKNANVKNTLDCDQSNYSSRIVFPSYLLNLAKPKIAIFDPPTPKIPS